MPLPSSIGHFLRSWLESWTGNNPQRLLEYYHNDIFYADPAHRDGIKGKDELGIYFTKLLRRYPDWRWELVSFDEAGPSRIYLKWQATIPGRDGVKTAFGMDLIELRDGLIIRNEVYFDPSVLQ